VEQGEIVVVVRYKGARSSSRGKQLGIVGEPCIAKVARTDDVVANVLERWDQVE
jgi:hypothetical protein